MKKINIAEKSFNPFDLIGQKWMLISAGTEDKWNTMTASWGAVGVMWGKPSATCYIRKQPLHQGVCRRRRVFHPDRAQGRQPSGTEHPRLQVRP